ncbi:MAG: DUF4258 domain-containing protein [Solirubrobacterales bacterium]
MEFTRHARNEMRLYSISRAEVEAVVDSPLTSSSDRRGNPRLTGPANDRIIVVVLARDDPSLVITTFERS